MVQARALRSALLDDLAQDLRYGLRTMVKYRSFTVVTVFTLALGIGACTAIFSLVNAVLIRSLPYGDPARLVYLFTPNPSGTFRQRPLGRALRTSSICARREQIVCSYDAFNQTTYNLAGSDRAERVGAAKVDADFFRTLEVAPELGRGFDAKDEQPGNEQVASDQSCALADDVGWARRCSGSTLRLDGVPYRVVGVMPAEFGYPHKSGSYLRERACRDDGGVGAIGLDIATEGGER